MITYRFCFGLAQSNKFRRTATYFSKIRISKYTLFINKNDRPLNNHSVSNYSDIAFRTSDDLKDDFIYNEAKNKLIEEGIKDILKFTKKIDRNIDNITILGDIIHELLKDSLESLVCYKYCNKEIKVKYLYSNVPTFENNITNLIYTFCNYHLQVNNINSKFALEKDPGKKKLMTHFFDNYSKNNTTVYTKYLELALILFGTSCKHLNIRTHYYIVSAICHGRLPEIDHRFLEFARYIIDDYFIILKKGSYILDTKMKRFHILISTLLYQKDMFNYWKKLSEKNNTLSDIRRLTNSLIESYIITKNYKKVYDFIIKISENNMNIMKYIDTTYPDIFSIVPMNLKSVILMLLRSKSYFGLKLMYNKDIYSYAFLNSDTCILKDILDQLSILNIEYKCYRFFIDTKAKMTSNSLPVILRHAIKINSTKSIELIMKQSKYGEFYTIPNLDAISREYPCWINLFYYFKHYYSQNCLHHLFTLYFIRYLWDETSVFKYKMKLIREVYDFKNFDKDFYDKMIIFHNENKNSSNIYKLDYKYYYLIIKLNIINGNYNITKILNNILDYEPFIPFNMHKSISIYISSIFESKYITRIEYDELKSKLTKIQIIERNINNKSFIEFRLLDYIDEDEILKLSEQEKVDILRMSTEIVKLNQSRKYIEAITVFKDSRYKLDILHKMHNFKKLYSDIYSNAIISCLNLKDSKMLEDLLKGIELGGCYMNISACCIYINIIKNYSIGSTKILYEILYKLEEYGIRLNHTFVINYCTLMHSRDFKSMKHFYIYCKKSGFRLNVRSFIPFIKGGLIFKGWVFLDWIYQFFIKMGGFKENTPLAFNLFLEQHIGYIKNEDKFKSCWNKMTKFNITPDINSYVLLLKSYFIFNPVKVDEAVSLVEKLKFKNIITHYFITTFVSELENYDKKLADKYRVEFNLKL